MNAFLIVWITAFLVVSSWDWDEEANQEAEYAQMVCTGSWPDYKESQPKC